MIDNAATWMPRVPATAPCRIAALRRRRFVRRRETRRRRLFAAGAMALLAVAIVLSATIAGFQPSSGQVILKEVRVRRGESLWTIAAQAAIPGQSTREAVTEIRALNELEGSLVAEGSVLLVPSPATVELAAR